GWTGANHQHLIAFMVTILEKLYSVRVHDASNERKMAENLFKLFEEVVETLRKDWGVHVIAIVTDASGEGAKAWRMYKKKYKLVIVLNCYGHQVNLVVGDYFKATDISVLKYTDDTAKLITWLQSKTQVLAAICAV
ncbi:hypothetical protein AX16_009400, partial [Volvariella volvacea WC 439]